jgi:hypothetical protein
MVLPIIRRVPMRLIKDVYTVGRVKHTSIPYKYMLQNKVPGITFQLRVDCIHIWIIKARNRIGPAHMSYCKLFGVHRG